MQIVFWPMSGCGLGEPQNGAYQATANARAVVKPHRRSLWLNLLPECSALSSKSGADRHPRQQYCARESLSGTRLWLAAREKLKELCIFP